MKNILNYLEWRGDIDFEYRPFNEIDALIFGVIGYMEWDNIVGKKGILLQDACKQYFKIHTLKEIEKRYIYSPDISKLMKILKNVKRYKDVYLSEYVSISDHQKEVQFCAVTISVGNFSYISYRGTDSTILGWKEDLNMTFKDEIPSQNLAREYLEKWVQENKRKNGFSLLRKKAPALYLGGHSKGGNLAMYAALCAQEAHVYIKQVYNFDGPGFREGFFDGYNNTDILKKITTYLPEESIIGRLMIHQEKQIVVKGRSEGLQQHDAFYWECGIDKIQRAEKLSETSDNTKAYIEKLLLSKSDQQKEEFITLLFKVLKDTEIKNISDFMALNLKQGMTGIKELTSMSSEDRKLFIDCLKLIWSQSKSILTKK